MTNIKVTELPIVSSLDDADLLMAVHLSDGSDGSKAITVSNMRSLIIGTAITAAIAAHVAASDPHTQYRLESVSIAQSEVTGLVTSLDGKIDKARMPYNVLDYGIVADNTTNNIANFKSLLSTVSTAGGGTIYVPLGTYFFNVTSDTDCLMVPSNVTIYGDPGTKFRWSNWGSPLIGIVEVHNVTIRDITFEWGGTFGTTSGGRTFKTYSRSLPAYQYCCHIVVNGADYVTLKNLNFYGTTTSNNINQCVQIAGYDDGVTQSKGLVVDNLRMNDCCQGIGIEGQTGFTITNLYCERHSQASAALYGPGHVMYMLVGTPCSNGIVNGVYDISVTNDTDNLSGHTLSCKYLQNVVVTNVTCKRPAGPVNWTQCTNVLFSNIKFTNDGVLYDTSAAAIQYTGQGGASNDVSFRDISLYWSQNASVNQPPFTIAVDANPPSKVTVSGLVIRRYMTGTEVGSLQWGATDGSVDATIIHDGSGTLRSIIVTRSTAARTLFNIKSTGANPSTVIDTSAFGTGADNRYNVRISNSNVWINTNEINGLDTHLATLDAALTGFLPVDSPVATSKITCSAAAPRLYLNETDGTYDIRIILDGGYLSYQKCSSSTTGNGALLTTFAQLFSTGNAVFGPTSGGTYNGNVNMSASDHFPGLQLRGGTTAMAQFLADAQLGDFFADVSAGRSLYIRDTVGGGGGNIAQFKLTGSIISSPLKNVTATAAAAPGTTEVTFGAGNIRMGRTADAGTDEVVRGNDSRLTNARTPTAHTHPESDVINLVTDLAGKVSTSLLGAANGVATLDAGGKLLVAQLPATAITDTFVVGSQAAMLALSVEVGDVAVRTDLQKSFILQTLPPSTLGNWVELLSPTAAVTSVNGNTGAVVITLASLSGQPLDGDLTAIAALTTTGYAKRTATDTWTLNATIPWSDISGAPTYALDSAVVHITGTETVTGAKTFSSNLKVGNDTGNKIVRIGGGNTASADGSGVYIDNNSVTIGAFGNYSALIGGTYDAGMLVYSTGSLRTWVGGAVASLTDTSRNFTMYGSISISRPTANRTMTLDVSEAAASASMVVGSAVTAGLTINGGTGGLIVASAATMNVSLTMGAASNNYIYYLAGSVLHIALAGTGDALQLDTSRNVLVPAGNIFVQQAAGAVIVGRTSGGTNNGNAYLGAGDQYPLLAFRSGAGAVCQIIGDAANGDMYMDVTAGRSLIIRDGVGGTNGAILTVKLTGSTFVSPLAVQTTYTSGYGAIQSGGFIAYRYTGTVSGSSKTIVTGLGADPAASITGTIWAGFYIDTAEPALKIGCLEGAVAWRDVWIASAGGRVRIGPVPTNQITTYLSSYQGIQAWSPATSSLSEIAAIAYLYYNGGTSPTFMSSVVRLNDSTYAGNWGTTSIPLASLSSFIGQNVANTLYGTNGGGGIYIVQGSNIPLKFINKLALFGDSVAWATGALTGEPTDKHVVIGYDSTNDIGYIRAANTGTAFTKMYVAGSEVGIYCGASTVAQVAQFTPTIINLITDVAVAGGKLITLGASGLGAPAFTTRSAGTKIVLYDTISGASADFALGTASGKFWCSIGTSASQFSWYAGTTEIATLSGTGLLTAVNMQVGANQVWHAGLAAVPPGGTGSFLRSDGTWVAVSAGSNIFWSKITNSTMVTLTTSTTATPNRLHYFASTSAGISIDITAATIGASVGDVVGFVCGPWASNTQNCMLYVTTGANIAGRPGQQLSLLHNNTVLLEWDGTNWLPLVLDLDTPWVGVSNTTGTGAITITGTTSNPTKGTRAEDMYIWCRKGRSVRIRMVYDQTAVGSGAAGSGDYLITLPHVSMSFDTSFLPVDTTIAANFNSHARYLIGTGSAYDGTTNRLAAMHVYDSTRFRILTWSIAGASVADMSSTSCNLNLGTLRWQIEFEAAMSSW